MERSNDLSMDQAFLQSFKEIVLSNLENEQFGAEDLSLEIGLSRSQVHRKLQKINGKSITQFIRETRLEVAYDLLIKEVATSTEISYKVGFSSPAYFTKCFHDYFGYPPSEAKYRTKVFRKTSKGSGMQISKLKSKSFLGGVRLLVLFLTALLGWYLILKEYNFLSGEGNKEKIDPSLAILPIDYLSQEEDKQYLADGVMNAITSNLAKIEELKVIAGTSVQRYKEQKKDVRDIGKELGVSYILESSFQLVGKHAILFIKIHSAKEGSVMWTNEYDREWTEVFEVQSEVSQKIASEIAVTVSPETKRIFEESPTNDLTAYDYYLRGEDYIDRSMGEEELRLAMRMYDKAIEIDSSFTLAWVGLAASSRFLYWFGYDRIQNRIEQTRFFLNNAIKLNPDLKEVKMEHAKYLYHIEWRYEDALNILEKLNSEYPRNADIYFWMATILQRMGNFDEANQHYVHAINLDPINWLYLNNIGYLYLLQRNFEKAEKSFRRLTELYPSREGGYWGIYYIYYRQGKIDKLSELLHNYDIPIDSLTLQIEANLLDENFEEAISKILGRENYIRNDFVGYYSNNYLIGLYYYLASENERARKYFYKEKLFLENKLPSAINDVRIYYSLGIVYAGLGDKKKAIEAGERAIEICNDTRRAFYCASELYMARIYLMVGEYDKGIEILESKLSAQVGVTNEYLKNHYEWRIFMKNEKYRGLVNDPKYQIKNIEISN